MTVHTYSTLSNNSFITFLPGSDLLQFDNATINAATGKVTQSGANLVFNYAGKIFTLTGISLGQLTTTNVTFANGSMIKVGDNTTNTANDAVANTVNGGVGNDLLYGLAGNDTLNGNAGNDILNGGTGNDSMKGGTGDDTYVVNVTTDIVSEALNAGTDLVQSTATYTLSANVENLTLLGTAGISGTGNTLANILTGNSAANTLTGDAGNDTLIGRQGNDALNGGNGSDTASYAYLTALTSVSVSLDASGNGTATITGGETDTLTGIENLTGGAGKDTLTGNGAANVLNGGLGSDTLSGGAGNDTYIVNVATDIVNEALNAGTADLVQSAATYTLSANVENLTLLGTAGIRGTGNVLNNVLTGNSGNNTLNGSLGVDTLVGGDGNDTLKLRGFSGDSVDGGVGTDTLYLSVADQFKNGTITNVENIKYTGFTAGVDTVTIDFGRKAYIDTDVLSIDLTGFALEDKLIIAQHDGILANGTAQYNTKASGRFSYIHEKSVSITASSSSTRSDRVSWAVGGTKANLISGTTLGRLGEIQLTGLPAGLPDSQFVFV